MRLIDADALMERACNLEAQALAYVGKVVNDESKIEEWKIWSAILAERTAFKHDVFDAPTIEPQRKKGEWIPEFNGKFTGGAYWFSCSKCKRIVPEVRNGGWNFCPNCGADMRDDDIPIEYFESGGK